MNCWICSKPADSREHRIKKGFLTTIHGKGPYKGDNAKLHMRDGRMRNLQGPDSNLIKYKNNLCSECNNKKTQPYDRAVDTFVKYVLENESKILKYRIIDFSDVYGGSFPEGQLNLFKYYVKLLGCDLADGNMPIPWDLPDLLGKDSFQTRLRITFAVNEDKLLLDDPEDRTIGAGTLHTSVRNLENKDDPTYVWHTYFSFLHTYFWYNAEVDGPYGAKWIADSQFLYLGSISPLSDEQRKELLENNNNNI